MKAAKLLAFAAVLGMVGFAMAADKEAPKKKRVRTPGIMGTIADIEGKVPDLTLTIDKRTRGSKETTKVTVKTDVDTKVTIDRKEAELSGLTKGMYVRISPVTGTAKRISAWTKRPERKRKPKEE